MMVASGMVVSGVLGGNRDEDVGDYISSVQWLTFIFIYLLHSLSD